MEVHGLPAVPDPATRFGTELAVASGNRGAGLLASQTMGAVELYLDPSSAWMGFRFRSPIRF